MIQLIIFGSFDSRFWGLSDKIYRLLTIFHEKFYTFTWKTVDIDHIMVYYKIIKTLTWSGKTTCMGGYI